MFSAFGWLLAILFFILWMVKKPQQPNGTPDDPYTKGFWDGYNYLIDRLKDLIRSATPITTQKLNQIIHEDTQGEETRQTTYGPNEASDEVAFTLQQLEAAAPTVYVSEPKAIVTVKVDNSVRNLNTILYMASFLLTASAAAFIAASMPVGIKLAGLIIAVAIFYGVGLILYVKVKKLRVAAVAFVGTGLAILPFIGFALHILGGIYAPAAWLIISVIGILAYAVAALVLKSQVVAYLTMAFTLSLASSFVAVASIGFVWYFVVLILMSVIANLASYLKPRWLPKLFEQPIQSTGNIVTPLAIAASLVSYQSLDVHLYEIVFSTALLHYIVVYLQQRTVTYETIVRFVAHVTLLLYALGLDQNLGETFGIVWLILSVAQAGYSLLRLNKNPAVQDRDREYLWLITMLGSVIVGIIFWKTYSDVYFLSLFNLTAFGLISMVSALKFRSANWAYPGFIVSIIVPYILTQKFLMPALPLPFLATLYIVMALTALFLLSIGLKRHSRQLIYFFTTCFWVYFAAGVVETLIYGNAVVTSVVFAVVAIFAVINSYVTRQVAVEILGGVSAFIALTVYLTTIDIAEGWFGIVLGLSAATLLGLATLAHSARGEVERRNYSLVLTLIYTAVIVLSGFSTSAVTVKVSYALLLAASFASVGLYYYAKTSSYFLRYTFQTSSLVYIFLVWCLGLVLHDWWLVVSYGVGAILLWLFSRSSQLPLFLGVGNVSVIGFVYSLLATLGSEPQWLLLATIWVSSAIILASYGVIAAKNDTIKLSVQMATIGLLLIIAIYSCFGADVSHRTAGALTLLVGAGLLALHAYFVRYRVLTEISIYIATLALQWLLSIYSPNISFIFYVHWWAIEILIVAYFLPRYAQQRIITGLSILSLTTASYALSNGGGYALLFLVEHLAYLVVGALRQKTWLIWWGIIASVVAVMYYLREFLYLWLGFLGLFLIGIVIWRLIRSGTKR